MHLVRMSLSSPGRGTGAPKKSSQKVVAPPKPKPPTAVEKDGVPKRRGRPPKHKEEDPKKVAAAPAADPEYEEEDEEAEARPSKRQQTVRPVGEADNEDDDEDDERVGMDLGLPRGGAEALFKRFANHFADLMDRKLDKHLEKTSELITNVVPGEVKKALENRSVEDGITASSVGTKPQEPPRPIPVVLQSSAGVKFVVNVAQLLGACQPPNAPKLKGAHFVNWLVLSYKEKFRTLPSAIKNSCTNGNQELNDEVMGAMFASACACFKNPKPGAAIVKLPGLSKIETLSKMAGESRRKKMKSTFRQIFRKDLAESESWAAALQEQPQDEASIREQMEKDLRHEFGTYLSVAGFNQLFAALAGGLFVSII